MRPSFLFPVCEDCGATLLPLNCGGASHICATPNSRNRSAVASASNSSMASRQARSAAGFRFPVMSSSPSAWSQAREVA